MINKVLLMGASGKGNYGDELLAWTAVHLLKSINPLIEGTILSYNPIVSMEFFEHQEFDYASYYKYFPSLKYPESFIFFKSLKRFKDYEAAVFPGGGFLYDYSLSALLSWYRRFLAFKKISLPVILLCVGIGPLRTALSKFLARKILDLCQAVIARDKISYDLAVSVCSDPAKIKQGADLNILFEKYAGFAKKKASSSKRCVIMPRVWPYAPTSEHTNDLVNSFLKLIVIAREYFNLESVEFVPMHRYDDTALCQKISSKIMLNSVVYKIRNFKDLHAPLSNASMIFSMRYHGILLSLLYGKSTVAIAYDEKINSLMNEFSRSGNTISWNEFIDLDMNAIARCFEHARKDNLKDVPGLLRVKQEQIMNEVKAIF